MRTYICKLKFTSKIKKILRINVYRVKFHLKYANMPFRVFRTVNKGKLHDLVNFTLICILKVKMAWERQIKENYMIE
jgi:hypothetical protein